MITSSQNSRIKLVRALFSHSKHRQREGRIALEGLRLIQDVLGQGYPPEFALFSEDVAADLAEFVEGLGCECLQVDPKLFKSLADTANSQGIIAVFPMPQIALPDGADFVVGLDQVRDPGNVGSIIRAAAAAGADGVVALPGTVDVFNPKVIRAGMGAHFRLPLLGQDWQTFTERFGKGWAIWRAEAHAQDSAAYHQIDWIQPSLIIIGGEAHGLSESVKALESRAVYIPMAGGVESLNAAAAAAVLMFEVKRARS